ncbi:hypothetical protein PSPO01_13652 [Paraphaeosphaeria sporulosa]
MAPSAGACSRTAGAGVHGLGLDMGVQVGRGGEGAQAGASSHAIHQTCATLRAANVCQRRGPGIHAQRKTDAR